MPTLVIDIGNTLVKAGVFDGSQLLEMQSFITDDEQPIRALINQYKPQQAIISTVKKNQQWWVNVMQACQLPCTFFNVAMAAAAGIKNHYATPQTLGTDRLAAVTGAHLLHGQAATLVIGAGTCITCDWVDHHGNYFGGSISPGLKMRYNALNYYTAGLPLINADASFDALAGNSTQQAIIAGVQNGIKFELEGFINNYTKIIILINLKNLNE